VLPKHAGRVHTVKLRLVSHVGSTIAGGGARSGEWWEHKLSPMLGTAYATTFFIHRPLLDVMPTLLFTLAAVAVGAVYVSVINDLTDRRDDRLAGKPNRLDHLAPWSATALIVALLAAGGLFAILGWRHQTAPLITYAAAWLVFSAYSVPPLRLKTRGAFGVLADAAGAHLFPQLLAAFAVFSAERYPVNTVWVVLVGVWAMASGIRCALWHQLEDSVSDQRINCATFGAQHPQLCRTLGRTVLFPLELVALTGLLLRAGNPVALALAPVYAVVELERALRHQVRFSVVDPADGDRRSVLDPYYIAVYPIGFLVGCALQYPAAIAILAFQLLLFPQSIRFLADLHRLARGVVRVAATGARERAHRTTW
jgi:4-hydroxybenzoate polyprenyltransferase